MFRIDKSKEFKLNNDKYNLRRFVPEEDGLYDFLDAEFLIKLRQLPVAGIRMVTEEKRPDLLSYNIYGSVDFWWILLYYNDLVSPDDLKYGMIVKYPSVEDIEFLIQDLARRP